MLKDLKKCEKNKTKKNMYKPKKVNGKYKFKDFRVYAKLIRENYLN